MTRPVDPRLLRLPALRAYLITVAASGGLSAALVVAQATALARLLAAAVAGRLDRAALGLLVGVVAVAALRYAVQGLVAARAVARVKAALRAEVLAATGTRGPAWLTGQRAGEIATLVGRGVDALDAYLTGYLPQLVLGVTVPVGVLLWLAFSDPGSALIVVLTLPLIPIFAILVGWQTRSRTEKQWRLLATLGGHFLDMVSGLATLRAFGRAAAQVEVVRRMADRYREATMRTLRLAFLSGLVLELVATVSVALVAVPVGLRLLSGGLTLPVALTVLILTPEAYGPLRAAGAQFHASQEGLAAAADVFALIDTGSGRQATAPAGPATGPAAPPARRTPGARAAGPARADQAPDPGREPLVFDRVTVRYGEAEVLRDVSFTVQPGERIALVGPSGGGKSTLLALILGFITPADGRILVGDVDLATVDPAAWRSRLAWVPQRPHLFAASVADNIRLGAPDAPLSEVRTAARAAAADAFVEALPDGYDTRLGERGHGLSSGQRQRLALARAFLRTGPAGGSAPLLLLDEPTARLDAASEAAVVAASRRLAAGASTAPPGGSATRTALLVAHRPALLAAADRVLVVRDGRVLPAPDLVEAAVTSS